jgi:uncharacterized membrane protein
MMSQNRQDEKDRARAEYDYKVNMQAELQIRHLNAKVKHFYLHLSFRWTILSPINVENY